MVVNTNHHEAMFLTKLVEV